MVCSRQREEVQHQEDEVVGQTQQKPPGRLRSRLARGDQAEESAGPAEMVMLFEFAHRNTFSGETRLRPCSFMYVPSAAGTA